MTESSTQSTAYKQEKRPDQTGSASCEPGFPMCRAHRHWNSTSYRTAAGSTGKIYGAEGSRTPDLCSAIAALSQLSYSPESGSAPTLLFVPVALRLLTTRPRSRGAGPSARKLSVPGRKSTHSHTRRRWEFQRNSANCFCLRMPSLPTYPGAGGCGSALARRSHHGSGPTEVLRRPASDGS